MWSESLGNGRYKFIERYKDPYTEKWKKTSTVLTSDSSRAWKNAQKILDKKIEEALSNYDKSDITFKELYEEWFVYYQQYVKRTSWTKVPKMMKHIQKVISDDVLVRNIDENMIRNITEKMYTFGELSLNYTKQTKTTLSIMLNYAVEKKYIKQNLALNVKIQRKKAEEEKRKKNMDEKYLDQSEMTELLVYMRKSTKRLLHANIAELLYLTGLRYGELQALQVKDFDGSTLDINGTLDYSFLKMADAIKTSPKNIYSKRIVSLPNRAVKIVNEIIEHNSLVFGSQSNEDYIFKSSRGTPLSLHSFNMVLHRVQDELKWDKNLSSHIFRHSHISLLAELNLPLKTIMERVGHSDANTTLSIYNHVTKKSKEQVIDRLNNL
ncbi:hypothetical protein IGI82_000842 [Enterococcus sp. AZ067]|uniref:tyrosine-type recombinase/integrase n=1 Tax=Enterococcus sp. AZ067 TaxID=2774674 RepID=UPI003F204885